MGVYDLLPTMLAGHVPVSLEWAEILQLLAGTGPNGGLIDARVIVKAADDTTGLTSNTTMTNDPDLLFPVAANATYEFRLHLFYAAAAGPQIKIGWSIPSLASIKWEVDGLDAGITSNSSGITDRTLRSGSTPTLGVNGAASKVAAKIEGTLITAGVSGTLQLQRAQASSSSTASTIGSGTRLTLARVA